MISGPRYVAITVPMKETCPGRLTCHLRQRDSMAMPILIPMLGLRASGGVRPQDVSLVFATPNLRASYMVYRSTRPVPASW